MRTLVIAASITLAFYGSLFAYLEWDQRQQYWAASDYAFKVRMQTWDVIDAEDRTVKRAAAVKIDPGRCYWVNPCDSYAPVVGTKRCSL